MLDKVWAWRRVRQAVATVSASAAAAAETSSVVAAHRGRWEGRSTS